MAPNRFKNSDFIRRILAVSGDLDTIVMLSNENYTEAYNTWVRNFAKALNALEHIYTKIEYSVTPNITYPVDLILARKSLQYTKIAEKYLILKTPHIESEKKIKLAIESSEHLSELERSLKMINRYSLKQKEEFKNINLKELARYQYLYERLDLLSRLTVDGIITRMNTTGEV